MTGLFRVRVMTLNCNSPLAQLAQRVGHDRGREALTHQVLVESRVLGGGDRRAPVAQFLLDGAVDQRPFVDIAEDVGDSGGGDVAGDALGVKFTLYTEAPAAFDVHSRPRVRVGHAVVVERSRFNQVRDGGVDIVARVLAIEQARAALGYRQFAAGEEAQRIGEG